MKNRVSIIGLGYVGLPLAVLASKSGYKVNGIDIDVSRIEMIKNGYSPIEDVQNSEIKEAIKLDNIQVGSDFSVISESNVVVICVPTPLDSDRKPDLSLVESAVKSFGHYLTKSTLIILESTVQPGTTRDFLYPLITKHSKLSHNDFLLAYSPERIDPLNQKWRLSNTPKVVSGLSGEATKAVFEFYSKFVENLHVCDSLEIAELSKLLENTFRYVNISFINELSIFCGKLGVDINEVISAAATKPYGFMPFYPSVGVGGHCIPVDPIYLANAAKAVGVSIRSIELADQINQEMPGYFIGRAEEKLAGLKNRKVLVVGVSYKPNVADVRESPVEALISGLKQKGAQVLWHDDLVKEWNGEKSVALSNKFDLAILATPHDYLDLTKLGDVPILNTRGSI